MSQDLANNTLFAPLQVGNIQLDHRVVLAPLTRVRGTDDDLCPGDLQVEYYSQRASKGGLVITEGTIIAPQSIASRHIPCLFTQKQAEAWKRVTDAVHEKGGFISVQIWHQGRAAHDSFSQHPLAQEVGARVCEGPSAIALSSVQPTYHGDSQPLNPPREMSIDDIKRAQQQYLEGARLALEVANFDFVEIHGAHGYLGDSFLTDGTNTRTDEYGGNLENRMRFLLETVDLLTKRFPKKVSIRVSPHRVDVGSDSDPDTTYSTLLERLSHNSDLAYILLTETRAVWGEDDINTKAFVPNSSRLLGTFSTTNPSTKLISAGGYSPKAAYDAMGRAEPYHNAIGFGRWFISNPDLPFRLRYGLPLNKYNRHTFYVFPHKQEGDEEGIKEYVFDVDRFNIGYTDYQTFAQIVQTKLGPQVDLLDVIGNQETIAKLIAATQNDPYPLIALDDIGYTVTTAQRSVK